MSLTEQGPSQLPPPSPNNRVESGSDTHPHLKETPDSEQLTSTSSAHPGHVPVEHGGERPVIEYSDTPLAKIADRLPTPSNAGSIIDPNHPLTLLDQPVTQPKESSGQPGSRARTKNKSKWGKRVAGGALAIASLAGGAFVLGSRDGNGTQTQPTAPAAANPNLTPEEVPSQAGELTPEVDQFPYLSAEEGGLLTELVEMGYPTNYQDISIELAQQQPAEFVARAVNNVYAAYNTRDNEMLARTYVLDGETTPRMLEDSYERVTRPNIAFHKANAVEITSQREVNGILYLEFEMDSWQFNREAVLRDDSVLDYTLGNTDVTTSIEVDLASNTILSMPGVYTSGG